jgi:hypothetical protein
MAQEHSNAIIKPVPTRRPIAEQNCGALANIELRKFSRAVAEGEVKSVWAALRSGSEGFRMPTAHISADSDLAATKTPFYARRWDLVYYRFRSIVRLPD